MIISIRLISVCLLLLVIQSCSVTRTVALNTTAKLIRNGAAGLDTEHSWDSFKESAPGTLKTVEGFLYNAPENPDLLTIVIKGYAGFGFAVHESLYINDKLKDLDYSQNKSNAIDAYTRSVHYGWHYLASKGIKSQTLIDHSLNPIFIKDLLESELSTDDTEAVFYTAQAWAGIINLQRTNLALVAQMPIVKAMFDWSCEKNPTIQYGACSMFYGLYELSRPKILGGNPAKGKQILQNYAKENPYNMLAKVTYLEYVIVNAGMEKEYKSYKGKLKRDFNTFKKLRNLGEIEESNPFLKHPELNLVNAIALKRFEMITKNEKELF